MIATWLRILGLLSVLWGVSHVLHMETATCTTVLQSNIVDIDTGSYALNRSPAETLVG